MSPFPPINFLHINRWLFAWLFVCLLAFAYTPALSKTTTDSLKITLEGINLSEDMSQLSSRNDEILLLIYEFSDSIHLSKPLLKSYFEVDSLHREFSTSIRDPKSKILVFLIEIDSELTTEQIEKKVRPQHQTILKLFDTHDLSGLHKILGDEDLLGTITYDTRVHQTKKTFLLKGRSKLDKFLYKLMIT